MRVFFAELGDRVYHSYGDLTEDLKILSARLRIPYDAETIRVALDRLEHGGRRLVTPPTPAPRLVARSPSPPLGHAEATAILAELELAITDGRLQRMSRATRASLEALRWARR